MGYKIPDLEFDGDDPYAREAQIYPRLSDEMADRVALYGTRETIPEGTLLFERGQRSVDFFLVLSGAIEIFELTKHGKPNVVTLHRDRQFTGELDLFNDRQILVSGRAAVFTDVIRVKRSDFRRMMSGEPDIGEIVMRAFILRRIGFIRHGQGGVILIGSGHAGDTLRIERFLTRNGYPHRLLDTDVHADAGNFFQCLSITGEDLPVVLLPGKHVLRNPANAVLADELGLSETLDEGTLFDVAVIGAGPAGLASAVYAASEGLNTLVIEALAPGGQAGTSSRIENYLGFPTGISGLELAGRAQIQAQKFGARLAISRSVVGLEACGECYRLTLDDETSALARTVVIATGARYRKLTLPSYARFEGQAIHYAATAMEAKLCEHEEVAVVGGGNSAGQAAIFLSRSVSHVHLLVRSDGLAATMSDYLVQSIQSSSRITLHCECEIVELAGEHGLDSITWLNHLTDDRETHGIRNLFVMIGAEPNTDWLGGFLRLDSKGFIMTGKDEEGRKLASPYATIRPGIYAVGDVRAGSVKRVASSVGEGSVVVQAIHHYLSPEV